MTKELRGEKEFFRQFLGITLPVAGQNLLTFAVSMADTVMVGQLGEVQLSAVQLANQLGFLMYMVIFGLCGGANVMIAQYWGKRDIEGIHKVMTVMYRILAVVTVLFTTVAIVFPGRFMSFFSEDAVVISEGISFLRVVGVGFIATGFASASLLVLRSVGNVTVSLRVYCISLVTNIFFNWVFIFGNLGAPAMGIPGAALATVIARFVELGIALGYLFLAEQQIRYRIHMAFVVKLGFAREFLRNALPVLLNEVLWGLGMITINAIVGRMGVEFTAAYSICMVLGQLASVAIYGAGNASAVIIGNIVGEGRYDLARKLSRRFLIISGFLGVIAGLMVLAFKSPFLSLYAVSDSVRACASQIMSVHAFVVLCQSFAMVSIVGVLRGGGDGKFAALIDVLPTWLVTIPLGYFAGHIWGWPVTMVYLALKIDEAIKTVIAMPRLLRGNWVKDITRKNE